MVGPKAWIAVYIMTSHLPGLDNGHAREEIDALRPA
jgi:hypothetical protein